MDQCPWNSALLLGVNGNPDTAIISATIVAEWATLHEIAEARETEVGARIGEIIMQASCE